VILFAGLARGKAAAVAPAAAACGGALPVAVGVILGERPSPLAWLGIVLAIPAILLCSWVADRSGLPGGGLGYGIAAGALFGTYTVLISRTAEASGLLPLIPARFATLVMMLVLAMGGIWRMSSLGGVPKGLVAAHGILDVSGNVFLILGLRSGSLALVSIAASVYPAVTVTMARIFNAEMLRKRQVLGVFLTLIALAFIARG
jgi:drug/metabolite transporter (DMT)-like permease